MWWWFALFNYFTMIVLISSQYCNFEYFNDVSVIIKTSNSNTESKVNLRKCAMSSSILPAETIFVNSTKQNIQELSTSSVSDLPDLIHLSLQNDEIKYIRSNAFYEVSSLINIDLSYNKIVSIWSTSFNNCESLTTLTLQHNLIEYIDYDAFKVMEYLITMDLSHNKLTFWNDEWVSNLLELNKLYMQGNRITFLPKSSFMNNNQLEYIDFSNNEMLTVHSQAFSGLRYLDTLKLNNNKINKFHPETFSMFDGSLIKDKNGVWEKLIGTNLNDDSMLNIIDNLSINNNHLTFLPKKMLNDLNRTEHIYVHSNPFQCACYNEIMKWAGEGGNVIDKNKKSCVGDCYPVCVSSLNNSSVCIEEVDEEVQEVYFKNYKL